MAQLNFIGQDIDSLDEVNLFNRLICVIKLDILIRIRLQEGFHFAHNDSGILNMILELPIKDQNEYHSSCVVQYIIFPPHVINSSQDRYCRRIIICLIFLHKCI